LVEQQQSKQAAALGQMGEERSETALKPEIEVPLGLTFESEEDADRDQS
jgi:hypothetical protein